jgi:hypothetical protein
MQQTLMNIWAAFRIRTVHKTAAIAQPATRHGAPA